MKRTHRWLAGATLALAVTAPAGAQAGISAGILGGVSIPVSNYENLAATGWHGGAFVDFGRRLGPFGLRAEGVYHGFGNQDVVSVGSGQTQFTFSNRYSIINGNLNLVLGIPIETSPIQPYLIGGGGAYYMKNSPRCPSGQSCNFNFDDSYTKFGVNGGAGVSFGQMGVSAFVEARYHNIYDAAPRLNCIGQSNCGRTAAQLVPITFGVAWRF